MAVSRCRRALAKSLAANCSAPKCAQVSAWVESICSVSSQNHFGRVPSPLLPQQVTQQVARLHVVGTDSHRNLQRFNGPVVVASPFPQLRQSLVGRLIAAIGLNRSRHQFFRLFVPSRRRAHGGQVVMGCRVLGLEGYRLLVRRRGLVETALPRQIVAEIVVDDRIPWI